MIPVKKPVRRSIDGVERGRDVILTLYPNGVLGFRVKRTRREFLLPVVVAYRQAVMREVEREQAEQRAAKGTRRQLRRRGLS